MKSNSSVTIREIIVVLIFSLFMIAGGYFIASAIHNHELEKSEVYFKALKTKDNDIFDNALKTNVGNVLAEGEISSVDPVKHKNLDGKYLFISEEEEHYVEKTRIVEYQCGEKTCTRTETYWEWDFFNLVTTSSKEFSFLGKTFKTKDFDIDNSHFKKTVSGGPHVRFNYYVTPYKYKASIFGKTNKNSLINNHVFPNKTISEIMKNKEESPKHSVYVFWFFWSILIIICSVIFVVLENRFLNNAK